MVDISEQVEYWRSQAREDWEVAGQLVDSGKTRHGLFFAHLALEKVLKAHVCQATQKVAPRLHNLSRLAEMAKLELGSNQLDTLAEMNEFNMEGRYPLSFLAAPTAGEARDYMS